jgi:PhoH-like ATPase
LQEAVENTKNNDVLEKNKNKVTINNVLDTSAILQRPFAILGYPNENVIIPVTTIDESNRKKSIQTEVGRNAIEFFKIYKKLRKITTRLHEPVKLENNGTFRIEINHKSNETINRLFPENENDHKIIAVAINLAIEKPNEQFRLISNDGGMIAKADMVSAFLDLKNFEAVLDEQDRLIREFSDVHTGYSERYLTEEMMIKLKKNKVNLFEEFKSNIRKMEVKDGEKLEEIKDQQDILVGDFIICINEMNIKEKIIVRTYVDRDDNKQKVRKMLEIDAMKNKGIGHKNREQQMLLDLLHDKSITCVSIIGKAGTGKTLLALAAALSQTEEDLTYRKILVARPIIPMGKDIGFLPGDKDEKLKLWMQPIFDNLEYIVNKDYEVNDYDVAKKTSDKMKEDKKRKNWERILAESPHIEMEALTYIRGRSIPKQFIIIDEAQNLTAHEVKTIVTRAGKGTKIIFAGDPDQIDNPYLDSVNNGLTYLTERMKGQKMFGTIKLEKTERSELAELASILL